MLSEWVSFEDFVAPQSARTELGNCNIGFALRQHYRTRKHCFHRLSDCQPLLVGIGWIEPEKSSQNHLILSDAVQRLQRYWGNEGHEPALRHSSLRSFRILHQTEPHSCLIWVYHKIALKICFPTHLEPSKSGQYWRRGAIYCYNSWRRKALFFVAPRKFRVMERRGNRKCTKLFTFGWRKSVQSTATGTATIQTNVFKSTYFSTTLLCCSVLGPSLCR